MLSDDARNLLEDATQAYESQIREIGHYLDARGITQSMAASFRLGYVKDPVVGHEDYRNRLAIPYDTPSGVVDIRFRSVVDDGQPKYLSRAGAQQLIYNVKAFEIDSSVIAVCEGELDTMCASTVIPAVGLPGAKGWKRFYWRAFQDYSRVYVLCDGDAAGKELGRAIATAVDTAVVIAMPDSMDVNDVYLSEGSDGLCKRMGLA
jgi:DNA primase